MGSPSTTYYRPRDVTSEQARDIRGQVWKFVFDCFASRVGENPEQDPDVKKRAPRHQARAPENH